MLTKREIQILYLIAEGYSFKQISRKIKLSDQTIKNYSITLRKKLEARNLPNAVYRYFV